MCQVWSIVHLLKFMPSPLFQMYTMTQDLSASNSVGAAMRVVKPVTRTKKNNKLNSLLILWIKKQFKKKASFSAPSVWAVLLD